MNKLDNIISVFLRTLHTFPASTPDKIKLMDFCRIYIVANMIVENSYFHVEAKLPTRVSNMFDHQSKSGGNESFLENNILANDIVVTI